MLILICQVLVFNYKPLKPKKMNSIKNLDDIKDLSIIIVNEMIKDGLIKDCTNTDESDEFDAQDIIRAILCNKFNIDND